MKCEEILSKLEYPHCFCKYQQYEGTPCDDCEFEDECFDCSGDY